MPDAGLPQLRPFMPYWAIDERQVDPRWIGRGGFEAIFFSLVDIDELATAERTLRKLPPYTPKTIHFPMDADYLRDKRADEGLRRIVDLGERVGAEGIVVHANQFLAVEEVSGADFDAQRANLDNYFTEFVSGRLLGSSMWFAVENMPLVGDLGDDVDAAFVVPEDFERLTSTGVGIVVDTAHLVGAIETRQQTADDGLSMLPPGSQASYGGFAALRERVRHLHFSAVEGVALPPRKSTAKGGAVPELHDGRYREVLSSVAKDGMSVSLEIAERDYTRRVNFWRALDCLRNWGFVS